MCTAVARRVRLEMFLAGWCGVCGSSKGFLTPSNVVHHASGPFEGNGLLLLPCNEEIVVTQWRIKRVELRHPISGDRISLDLVLDETNMPRQEFRSADGGVV